MLATLFKIPSRNLAQLQDLPSDTRTRPKNMYLKEKIGIQRLPRAAPRTPQRVLGDVLASSEVHRPADDPARSRGRRRPHEISAWQPRRRLGGALAAQRAVSDRPPGASAPRLGGRGDRRVAGRVRARVNSKYVTLTELTCWAARIWVEGRPRRGVPPRLFLGEPRTRQRWRGPRTCEGVI